MSESPLIAMMRKRLADQKALAAIAGEEKSESPVQGEETTEQRTERLMDDESAWEGLSTRNTILPQSSGSIF